MTKTVDFIFDFASPNAYLAHKVIPQIEARTGAKFKLVPSLLGGIFKMTENKPPMVAFQAVKLKLDYERLEMERFIKQHQLFKFKMNEHFPVNTLLLMRGAIVAQNDGILDKYVEVGLKAMWEDSQKMDDLEVFVQLMDEAGFDGENILQQTQSSDVKAALMANTSNAVDRGCFGIPTFFVGDEMFFGKDRLDQVEAELLL